MTNHDDTTTAYRPINDLHVTMALRPANWELGIRNVSSSAHAVRFQIGMGRSTCTVEVTLNARDLYDVEVFQVRKVRGSFDVRRTIHITLLDVYAEDLASTLIAAWCDLCTERGW
jgi:hypothetical protein